MPFFLTTQPVCAPVKDYYDESAQQNQWPSSAFGSGIFLAPEGWMTTDENGNAKRFSNHIIVNYWYEIDNQCKRWNAKNDGIYKHFNTFDTLVFYVADCYVLDFAAYFGGTDALGTGECVKHWQMKITGEKIETRYGEEDIYSGALTWVSQWTTPYAEKAEVLTATDDVVYTYGFQFNKTNNKVIRLGEVLDLNLYFSDGEYPENYLSELSFDSGAVPTMVVYYDSGILNWVGTDCTTVDGLSIFQPSANTHYDIVFYFNGTQFIGLVNGYVPSVSR